jgi:hypothetical protein
MNERMQNQEKIKQLKDKMCNRKFKHFKGGIYKVLNIAIHSETAEPMVVYVSNDQPELVWCRPLTMFLSEVDRKKYPNVAQKMRFEIINED